MATEKGNIQQKICLGLSAATGGLLAVLADIMQKQDASAVEQLKSALGTVLQVRTYPWFVGLLLIVLSVALSFIFSADSNKKSFYVGASILAIMMTSVPYDAKPGLNTGSVLHPTPDAVGATNELGWWGRFLIPSRVFAQNAAPSSQGSPVTVQLETTDKKPVSMATFTLVDPSNGQVVARSRVQGSKFTFYVTNPQYLLRVQVDGYAIAEHSLNPPPPSLTISLTPSSVPLSIQRLFRK
ncbi:MAG: hypothetical protein LAO30_01020 [Acidobacteriia bacterium]|nr:hypothetical protein [Terriglobia bacterium]